MNIGILGAVLANHVLAKAEPKFIFLVGVLPALLVFWIRRAVPETEEWQSARKSNQYQPELSFLFFGEVKRITLLVIAVCAISLSAHWAFMFWYGVHLRNLPEVIGWSSEAKNHLVNTAMLLVIGSSIAGNFFSGFIARIFGYRQTIAWMSFAYFLAMFGAYSISRNHITLLWWLPLIGFCQGLFALYTMYLPPLFPTLLRTTGAGFCYNIGRVIAACGTVAFGLLAAKGTTLDIRTALLSTSFLFILAGAIAFFLPQARD